MLEELDATHTNEHAIEETIEKSFKKLIQNDELLLQTMNYLINRQRDLYHNHRHLKG